MFKLFQPRAYRTPGGTVNNVYLDMLDQPHCLIAGASGSGKSVVLEGLIAALISKDSPAAAQLVLIDPKRVELVTWKALPHTIAHETEPAAIIRCLENMVATIDQRYKEAARKHSKQYDGPHIYIIIDELADLMTTNKKQIQPLLQRIMQVGRAARVHVIAATQCPLASVIPTAIKVNFAGIMGLHTRSAQDSRNIIGMAGLETLPMYGEAVYIAPGKPLNHTIISLTSRAEVNRLLQWWTSKSCVA